MQHCFSTLGCAELEWKEVLDVARRHRISSVELRALGGTTDLPVHLAERFGTPAEFAMRQKASGVRVTALDTSLKLFGSSDKEWRATIEAFLPWAEALGGVNLRVFDGGKTGDGAEMVVMADRLDWWRQWRSERGWRSDLMIETHDSLFTATVIQTLLAAAPSARILWDSHHTWKRGGEDPLVTWNKIAPSVVHIHVKDSVGRPSARHPFTYVLPGEGEFPMATLRTALGAGFAGPLSLEWERLWHPYLPPLEDALRAAEEQRWW